MGARRTVSFWLPFLLLIASAGGLSSCGKKKGDPQEAARAFFAAITSGDAGSAYRNAAFAFQAQQSEPTFTARVKELGLKDANVVLQPLESSDKDAKLNAIVTTKTGQNFPLIVTLQLDAGTWKVFSLKTPRSSQTGLSENHFTLVGKTAAFHEGLSEPVPDDAAQHRLVHETMREFANAIRKRSFSDLYSYASVMWRKQITESQLERAFSAFIEKDVNLSGIADVQPVFEGTPEVNSDGLLTIGGYYPTQPFRVGFLFKYIYEAPSWRLFGLDVYLRKPEEAPSTKAAPK